MQDFKNLILTKYFLNMKVNAKSKILLLTNCDLKLLKYYLI